MILPDFRMSNSVERPEVFLDWCATLPDTVEAGETFWRVLRAEWATFDGIDQEAMAAYMNRFLGCWPFEEDVALLPAPLRVYCGRHDGTDPGICWTVDRSVAERFARGERGVSASKPTIWAATIWPDDSVAMVIPDRDEKEVVLFSVPEGFEHA